MSIEDADRARRVARVLVSDLNVEWADAIRLGLEKDDLFERLGPQIERARVFYRARVSLQRVPDRDRIFDWALVDVMFAQNRRVRPYIL